MKKMNKKRKNRMMKKAIPIAMKNNKKKSKMKSYKIMAVKKETYRIHQDPNHHQNRKIQMKKKIKMKIFKMRMKNHKVLDLAI